MRRELTRGARLRSSRTVGGVVEVESDGHDIVGRNVTVASRLCDAAAPGEVLASAVVADLADSASDLEFGQPREHRLAGIDRPLVARAAHRR